MVNVTRHAPSSPIIDEDAMRAFRQQWQVYEKLVAGNFFAHREMQEVLHRVLVADFPRPFRFLDLACGDARMTVAALAGTRVEHYRGIDLSVPALEMAHKTVTVLPCPAELDEADFTTALKGLAGPVDVVWIGLSLHHLNTPDKLAFMHQVHASLRPGGCLMIYEPIYAEGETRDAYLTRFDEAYRGARAVLTPVQWQAIARHVRACDVPESPSSWRQLARDAGFHGQRDLFTDPSALLMAFCFKA